jgi:hypothetical protein
MKQFKKCPKCNEIKEVNAINFHRSSRRKSGFMGICKPCRGTKRAMGEFRETAIKNNEKKCSKCHQVKPLTDFGKKLDFVSSACKPCTKQRTIIDKDTYNEKQRKYLNKKREDPKYKEKMTRYKREYKRKRMAEDPIFKARINIRKLLNASIKRSGWRKDSKSFEILGCDWDMFKQHIENKFVDGMTWENHGQYGWHYDHIIPISLGVTQEEINKLNHYTNFQPLWWVDNLKKSNKLY